MKHCKRMLRHGPRTGVLAASIGALIATGGITTSVFAQEDDEDSDQGQQDTIIVTGTRIRRDDFSAAQATTVVTADDMQALGVVSVADMVNQLPNNIASVSPEATADSPFYLGASIANMRGLNPAYGTRTLTLLDSRRMTPTNNGGSVDMNFIPSALVGRIETVTGGASATYGADAMAGVVNVILDDNIENIRLDLNYQTTAEGDGDQYTMSLGTGFQFFDNNRGNLTIGLDSSRQDGIEDCATREVCQRGLGLFRNGSGETLTRTPHGNRGGDIVFEGLPEWVPQEGHRYTTTTTGVANPQTTADAGYPCATIVNGVVDTSACLTEDDYARGWYTFNAAGNDVIPYMTPDQVTPIQLQAVDSVGPQTGQGGSSFQGSGTRWSTPWGLGRSIYAEVPIVPSTDRDNLFMRFTYELEGGIEIGADLTYGQTKSESLQNAARNNLQSFCVMPSNAYMQPAFASDLMRAVYFARAVPGASQNFGAFPPNGSQGGCRQAPFLNGSYNRRDFPIDDIAKWDFAPGNEFHKDFSELVDRRNTNDSNSTSLTLTANGALFEGGSWTWDAYAQLGKTENRQTLTGWRAGRRWDLALDSVIDGWDTNGDGQVDVPVTDPQPPGSTPVVVCSTSAVNAMFVDNAGDLQNWGDFMRDRWDAYLYAATGDKLSIEEQQQIFADLSNGCVPFNPFGSQPFTAEQSAYIFPSLFEGTDNDQTAVSLSFSGDAWRGIGNAGPMRMAAGVDWRENDTQNMTDSNRFLDADFNFVGNSQVASNVQRIYGDNWFGRTTTQEAWVEFDLPLLRDRVAAQYLSINTSFRRTENESQRISGLDSVVARNTTREVESWKASMQWQPVDVMRVRMTRSVDTRAPSANELYATNSYSIEVGGSLEINNVWRFDSPDFLGQNQNRDAAIILEAGNAALQPERSITETLGLVFQPADSLPGLQVSVDYYRTTIKDGIREIDYNDTISLCGSELGERWEEPKPFIPVEDMRFCNNIEFGDPDPSQEFYAAGANTGGFFGSAINGPDGNPVIPGTPNPYYEIEGLEGSPTNIISVAESTINEEDYTSEGIDYSISYFTQLGGGGSINARALFTRFLKQEVFLANTFGVTDVSNQTGGSNMAQYFGTFSANYSPTPKIRGNLFLTYSKNAFSVTGQVRYTGSGKLDRQNGWLAPGETITYQETRGGLPWPAENTPTTVNYDPDLKRTVTNNDLPSWTTLNLNFSYDFGRSRLELDRFESLSAYLNIENVGDRIPTFFSGTGAGGINTALFSAMGRSYRMGVRMEF